MPEIVTEFMPYIVVVNAIAVASILIAGAFIVSRQKLAESPGGLQNFAELAVEWFVNQARSIKPDSVKTIAPWLASFFFFIFLCNLLALLPLPLIKIPPTSYYSTPLALALISVLGILGLSIRYKGGLAALKHLFWPNPLELISELSHILSLSLRLFGNIGGEFIVSILVVQTIPYVIPMIIHALSLIPAFIQAFIFTLLTANFLGSAISHSEAKHKATEPQGEQLIVNS